MRRWQGHQASLTLISLPKLSSPDNGHIHGDTASDSEITGDLPLNLISGCSGTRTGRLSTITIECTDESEISSIATVGVTVPHDEGEEEEE